MVAARLLGFRGYSKKRNYQNAIFVLILSFKTSRITDKTFRIMGRKRSCELIFFVLLQ